MSLTEELEAPGLESDFQPLFGLRDLLPAEQSLFNKPLSVWLNNHEVQNQSGIQNMSVFNENFR